MREIVNIQVGKCGNAIGTEFWEGICCEHGIDQLGRYFGKNPIQQERLNVYFTETRGCTYAPRSIMIDLETFSMDAVRSSPYGKIFKPDNFIFGTTGTSNIWPRGHFTEGLELAGIALDVIRREVENCDCFHGFQMIHSIGGGTGGGLGSLLVCRLKDEYPDRIISTYSIIPSPKVPTFVVEPYNAVLTFNHLIDRTHETFIMDNEALFNIVSERLHFKNKFFTEVNHLISLVMSGITACIRFPGPSNADLRKIAVNMVPFPRLHFFVPSFAPLTGRSGSNYRRPYILELISDLFDYKNLFAACDPRNGKFLTVACIFRGHISTKEVDKQMYNIQNRNSPNFVEWIPNNIKTAICYIPPPGFTTAATFIGNTTSIQALFKRIRKQFASMYKRKAFLHWYLDVSSILVALDIMMSRDTNMDETSSAGEGLEELEFEACDNNIKDLISEYAENEKYVVQSEESKTSV